MEGVVEGKSKLQYWKKLHNVGLREIKELSKNIRLKFSKYRVVQAVIPVNSGSRSGG